MMALTEAISAGADIREMQNNTLAQVVGSGFLDQWSAVSRIKKPIIAAVNGFAVSRCKQDFAMHFNLSF
jgi:enoyl-CoA hydratase/carnithine racemase